METFGSRELTRTASSDNDGFVPPSHFMGLKRTKSDMGVHEDVIDALSNRLGSRRVSISNDSENGDGQISKVVAEAAARVKGEDPMSYGSAQPTHGIKQNVSNLINKVGFRRFWICASFLEACRYTYGIYLVSDPEPNAAEEVEYSSRVKSVWSGRRIYGLRHEGGRQ